MVAEKGDCGMCSLRGVRADRGAGLAKGDGGMDTRGDSAPVLVTVLPLDEMDARLAALCSDEVVEKDVLES